jgi:hypothetical protein
MDSLFYLRCEEAILALSLEFLKIVAGASRWRVQKIMPCHSCRGGFSRRFFIWQPTPPDTGHLDRAASRP